MISESQTAAQRRRLYAHILPMGVFIAFLAVNNVLTNSSRSFWLEHATYWIYPLQTLACGALLFAFRGSYSWHNPARILFTLAAALVVFFVWISPQQFFGVPARTDGFNPESIAGGRSWLFWGSIGVRFLRLVVVVPILEEIFWRAFLLRYLIDENFERVSFGTFTWFSFIAVALAFCFSHQSADWPAALFTGVAYNLVAWRTRSLGSCILAHATTNLLLGLWIMKTGQWGFW
ncbi:MAG: CAAX prenyl protease-related protein [Verrucomicrobiota bacterium]